MSTWWRHAVIYQVYVRSFADSDGDGIGDLTGVRSRLPYLRDLGVDALWLNPFYPSPQADAGYDVADYRDVDPRFGTLALEGEVRVDVRSHRLDDVDRRVEGRARLVAGHRRVLEVFRPDADDHLSVASPAVQQPQGLLGQLGLAEGGDHGAAA